MEAGSVILQMVSIPVSGRDGPQNFLMAPIHHHFEKGLIESQVVMRFILCPFAPCWRCET
jgi:UDP-N-acetylmuramyl pentapeptide phosphotransferase/UDP-N-acetylglucosamine-1-phosphate transferase